MKGKEEGRENPGITKRGQDVVFPYQWVLLGTEWWRTLVTDYPIIKPHLPTTGIMGQNAVDGHEN